MICVFTFLDLTCIAGVIIINHNSGAWATMKTKAVKTSLKMNLVLLGDFSCGWILKVTRPSYFVRVPSYFEALWYPHLYFDRKSNI